MMQHPTPLLFLSAAAVAAALPAAWAQQEELPQSITAVFDAYCALPAALLPPLESATDKASADAAAPKLKAALEQLYDTRTKMQGLKELTPAQRTEVEKRYALTMRREWGKVYEQMFRLQREKCYGSAEFSRLYSVMGLMLGK